MYQESGQTGRNAGIICNSDFQPRKRKITSGKEASAETILNKKGAEGAADGMPLIGMLPPKQQQKNSGFSQSNGQAATAELCSKSKKTRSSLPLQRLQATKLRLGLPNVLNKNQTFPHVLCAIRFSSRSLPAVKMQQQENQQLELEKCVSSATIMKSRSEIRDWRLSTRNGVWQGTPS